jgi:cytochrome oxidase assembly protein ShyY1
MQLRPFTVLGLVLLPLLVLFTWLGLWQLQRMHEKQELIDRFKHPAELELPQAHADGSLFAHVRVSGRYNLSWHLLLDNKILDGRVGVQALTLFQADDGLPILVNRGWLPLPPDRHSLPEIPTPSGQLDISGILTRPAEGGVRLGEPENLENLAGTRLITYFDMSELNAVLGKKLSPWLIQLDAGDSTGFDGRNWQPTVMLPAQHGAYAVQWFALALAMPIIWLALGWKWRHQSKTAGNTAFEAGNQDES